MAVTVNLDQLLDEEFRDSTLADLVAAPVAALAGISEAEAEGLRAAFGIATIGDLADNPFVRAAVTIAALARAAAEPAP